MTHADLVQRLRDGSAVYGDLAQAAAAIKSLVRERDNWMDSAAEFQRNQQFYRGLLVDIGNLYGVAARTSDDGSIQDDVLALKVKELVVAERDAARERVRQLAQEAHDDIAGWASYASDYFQNKHDLPGDLAKWNAIAHDLQQPQGEKP
jgi:hypothetical protein